MKPLPPREMTAACAVDTGPTVTMRRMDVGQHSGLACPGLIPTRI